MPPPARKSSIGTARRGIQKAHIPYRGDNPEVGKKTGIAVAHVRRTSDGFEPFDQIIQQADKRTPPKPKKRKKSVPTIQQPELDDEDGEMSMDIVDSMYPSFFMVINVLTLLELQCDTCLTHKFHLHLLSEIIVDLDLCGRLPEVRTSTLTTFLHHDNAYRYPVLLGPGLLVYQILSLPHNLIRTQIMNH